MRRWAADTNRIIDAISGMGGVRGDFNTGAISHKVNLGYAAQVHTDATAADVGRNPTTNIYDNHDVAMPDNAYFGGNYHDPLVTSRSRTQGWLLSDTLGFFNDKVLFTAAARHQKVVVRNYSNATGLEDTSSRYTQSRWMPTFGRCTSRGSSCRCMLTIPKRCSRALWRRRRRPMPGRVPGSRTRSRTKWASRSTTVRSEDRWRCLKSKPNAISDTAGNYGLDGEQRNRGVEMNVFGEPMLGLRLNASTVWLDAKQTKTAEGATDGKDAIGVANFYAVLGAEYDIKPVEGLTATARVNHSGSQYADAANTKKLDSYTTRI